ncbi:hypothetical protein Gohar_028317, partial [Gossypium harknessii]|nr:hypothetical protein [Gossypium harknessii]
MGNCFSVQCGLDSFLLRGLDFIVGHANFVWKLKQTLPTLSAALEELKARRVDVKRRVDLAERILLKPLKEVQLWLSKAETMITEAEELVSNVNKMLQEISDLKREGAFEKVAEDPPPAPVVVRPEEQAVALESTIQKVWSCIVETNVGIIGLYGLGGVGKTTLLTKLNNKFSTTPNDFEVVIWAVVSKDYDVGKIQDRIGENIGFPQSWKNKSVDQKAIDICGILSNKRFVVLLDDLWKKVDLNLVECLEPEKAWELFQDKVGDEALNSHPDIPNLAKQVAERCGGLPLALITIGRAMACKTT